MIQAMHGGRKGVVMVWSVYVGFRAGMLRLVSVWSVVHSPN